MPNTTISPNMSLPVPNVGQDPGPDYAFDLNSCFGLIDLHDHSTGNGVPVTPAGLNISSDLAFNGNNATSLRSARFSAQGAPISLPADIGALYVSGVDLYYNDVSGNQIRITQSGGVVGSPGSISGLIAPASASYNTGSGTFIWQSAVNTAAKMDMGSIIIRKLTLSSAGITIQAPTALSVAYSITLPSAPPANTQFMTMDNAGVISFTTLSDITVGAGGTYPTIGAAIAAVATDTSILILNGTYTENVTLNKRLSIRGSGYGTVVNGTWNFATGSSDSTVSLIRFGNGFVTDSGVQELQVTNFWINNGFTITDNSGNVSNFYQGMVV